MESGPAEDGCRRSDTTQKEREEERLHGLVKKQRGPATEQGSGLQRHRIAKCNGRLAKLRDDPEGERMTSRPCREMESGPATERESGSVTETESGPAKDGCRRSATSQRESETRSDITSSSRTGKRACNRNGKQVCDRNGKRVCNGNGEQVRNGTKSGSATESESGPFDEKEKRAFKRTGGEGLQRSRKSEKRSDVTARSKNGKRACNGIGCGSAKGSESGSRKLE